MPVNGIEYDHESLQIEVEGLGIATTLMEVSYDAARDVDVITDQRGVPRGPKGVARKKFEGSFDATLALEEYDALAEGVGEEGVLGRPSYRVILAYQDDEQPALTDELVVRITKISFSSKEGEVAKVRLEGKQVALPSINGRQIFSPAGGR